MPLVHGCGPDELSQKLATEQSVIVQLLVSALEDQHVGLLAVSAAQLQATQQIGPEIGHWVNEILADG